MATKTTKRAAAKKKPKAAAKKGKTSPAASGGIEFNHAMVYVTDIQQSVAFYRDGLGFRVVDTYPGAYARLLSPRGASSIALHVVGDRATFDAKTEGMRLYFEVQRLDAFCKQLEKNGIDIDEQPKDMPWGWRHAYLRDPDGHEISLYWAGKKRFQPTKMK
jgi:catechol 2,3-dioxygenase-like lactoylglutathione lyase family enzyme